MSENGFETRLLSFVPARSPKESRPRQIWSLVVWVEI